MTNVDEVRRTAVRLIETLHEGPLRELLSDDLEWWSPGRGSLTLDELYQNVGKFRSYMAQPSRMTIQTVTVEDDRAAIECRGDGRLKDGRSYNNVYHFLVRVKDGKVVEVHEHNDTGYAATIFSDLLGESGRRGNPSPLRNGTRTPRSSSSSV